MKYLFIILLSIMAISCKSPSEPSPPQLVFVRDTVLVEDTRMISILQDSISVLNNKLSENRIPEAQFIAESRLNRIRKYVAICESKPSQKTFFFGWVKRALDE